MARGPVAFFGSRDLLEARNFPFAQVATRTDKREGFVIFFKYYFSSFNPRVLELLEQLKSIRVKNMHPLLFNSNEVLAAS